MSTIDIHTHAFPDGLAGRAISKLEAECPWKAVGKGTVKSLLKSMDAADVDVSVVCAIATKVGQAEGILRWCREIQSDRIDPLPSVHPDEPDVGTCLRRIAEEGFVGIKLHPMYQSFAIDEPRMDPLYSAASEAGLFIQFHCGLDIAFPPQDDRASPIRTRNVIDRFPDLKTVCTHMGGWRAWDLVEKHLIGRNVLLETSFSAEELGPQRMTDMIRRHGPGRVMFGTDWPWQRQDHARARIEQLGLDEKELRGILWSNAAKLMGY
jgi:predicted TIM-barrel fold metal-dependent hydrolase